MNQDKPDKKQNPNAQVMRATFSAMFNVACGAVAVYMGYKVGVAAKDKIKNWLEGGGRSL